VLVNYEKLISEQRHQIVFMPKTPQTYSKTPPKKAKGKKNQPKTQPKPVSITTRKSYWITLTIFTIVLTSVFGYFITMPLTKIAIMLIAVLPLIGFAFYIRFKPSVTTANKRATFIFVGASFIGFSIWAAMVLLLNAANLITQIASALGGDFFAASTLMICLISGAFIGDWISENREQVRIFFKRN